MHISSVFLPSKPVLREWDSALAVSVAEKRIEALCDVEAGCYRL